MIGYLELTTVGKVLAVVAAVIFCALVINGLINEQRDDRRLLAAKRAQTEPERRSYLIRVEQLATQGKYGDAATLASKAATSARDHRAPSREYAELAVRYAVKAGRYEGALVEANRFRDHDVASDRERREFYRGAIREIEEKIGSIHYLDR